MPIRGTGQTKGFREMKKRGWRKEAEFLNQKVGPKERIPANEGRGVDAQKATEQ